MRTATYDRLTQEPSDELLTTGEAAKLLNASRQHVVNLCDRGDAPSIEKLGVDSDAASTFTAIVVTA